MFNRCSQCKQRSVKRAGEVCTTCAPPVTSATAPAQVQPVAASAARAPAPTHRLGDKVAAIAKAVGIEQKPGCGCAERQKAFNEARNLRDVARAILRPNG